MGDEMIEVSVSAELLDAYRIDTEYDLYVIGECDDEEWFLIIDKEN